jgi:hypothetical protein
LDAEPLPRDDADAVDGFLRRTFLFGLAVAPPVAVAFEVFAVVLAVAVVAEAEAAAAAAAYGPGAAAGCGAEAGAFVDIFS